MQRKLNKPISMEFEEADIDKVWSILKERFGFNIKEWKKQFEDYFMRHATRSQNRAGFFCEFGHDHINPILNKILCRRDLHPTFNNLIVYVVGMK